MPPSLVGICSFRTYQPPSGLALRARSWYDGRTKHPFQLMCPFRGKEGHARYGGHALSDKARPCLGSMVAITLYSPEIFRVHIVEKFGRWGHSPHGTLGHRLPLADADLRCRDPVGFMVWRRILHFGPSSFDHQ